MWLAANVSVALLVALDVLSAVAVVAVVRLLRAGVKDHETQKRALRSALVAGEESGVPEALGIDAFIADKR